MGTRVSANLWNATKAASTSPVCAAVDPKETNSPPISAFGPLIVVLVACALVASPSAAFATSIPMGFISWDVTVPGVLGQFDIANETGPNSSGDATAPVVTPVGLGNLVLDVLLSNG